MVTEIAKEQGAYAAHFRLLQEKSGASTPSWLARLREGAFNSFEQQGFPTPRLEEWKYTNVAPLAKANFEPAVESTQALDLAALQPFLYEEARASRLVFVNGFYRPELSSTEALPAGVVAIDLAAALGEEKYAETLRERLARAADFNENGFTALNTALFEGGAFVLVPAGAQVDVPLHLLFLADGGTTSSPRVLVVAERGSSATVIESYAALGDREAYFTNAVVEVYVEEGARLEHYKVQREGADAFHVATTRAALARAGSFNLTTVTL
ncbi:MAG TPA: SufD family Fe-S cluster assembly protein, partial [Pyrinomonadaceae bacterium]|nr:SufD family Fe-S cluster assembly protein [Pyrinomonadaceae bacterium]